MTTTTAGALRLAPRRIAGSVRIAVYAAVIAALLAGSFVLGRVTHASTTIVRTVTTVQHQNSSPQDAGRGCVPHFAC